MKFLQFLLFAGLLLIGVTLARPAFADPIAEKSPQYAEITQTLDTLIQAQTNPKEAGFTAESLAQKIGDLRFQKYIMETSEDWGICRNDTSETIGVYTRKPKKPGAAVLSYLGAGETTDDDVACTGIYLPGDSLVSDLDLGGGPVAATIIDGSNLVISQNPVTNAIEFNLPLTGVFQADQTDLLVPELTQAEVAAQVPNAPVD
ncbi:MAG: hypothetical protein ICV62_14080 [Cyanobacteria bacterium Co-bin13]|nr:hypothetical protein [Cyanobacteria bacterium Co-bin13]